MINDIKKNKVEKIYSTLGLVELFAFLRVYKLKHNGLKAKDVLNVSIKLAKRLRNLLNLKEELKSTTIGKELWDACYIIPFNKTNEELRLQYKRAILQCIVKKPLLYSSENKPLDSINEKYNLLNCKEAI